MFIAWKMKGKTEKVYGSFVLFRTWYFHAFASVHCCLVVTCWERAHLFAIVCDNCVVVTFPCGILVQLWHLIVKFLIFAAFLT